jgi:hypothetical protein
MGRKKLRNDAAALAADDLSRSQGVQHVTYDNGPPWVGIIVISFLCLIVLLPILWWIAVFILDEAGVRTPERALAQGLMTLAWLLIVLLLGAAFVRYLVLAVLDAIFAHKQAMKEMDIEIARSRQLLAQRAMGHRANTEDQRFARLIQLVMWYAYDHLSKHGPYGSNDARPWSRGQAEKLVLAGETKPVGYSMAARVRPFLSEHLVIRDNQVNLLYDIPVTLRIDAPGNAPVLRDNDGFVFTN